MNSALLYRTRGRWMFWIAFGCAAAMHIGAVVLAKTKAERTTIQDFKPPGVDIEVVDPEPQQTPPEESLTPPPSPQISPDEETFREENRRPQPIRPHKRFRAASFTKGAIASFGSVKAMVLYAPRPIYPYEARRQRITGSGVALLAVDSATGTVTNVRITQSCGNVILDNATVAAFRQWRFRQGTASSVQVPITYTLMGASY
jgi:TonB family protein